MNASATNDVIQIDHVSKFYGEVMGLNDITVTIGPGVTGLLGPNGAGKSTLMKLITGQIKQDKGTIKAFGMPVTNNPAYYNMVGYCPEYEDMFDWMTGLNFVRYLVQLNGYSKSAATKMAKEAISICGMSKDQNRPINTYSKGMRQRVKIAQAIAHKPKILYLDEPLAGTDPIGRVEIIKLIRKLGSKRYGMMVLVSSHILHEVERMTNEMILIHKGRLLAWGNMKEIRSKLDQVPHSLIIRSDENRRLAQVLIELPEVSSVKIDKRHDGIVVKVANPDKFYLQLPKILVREKINIDRLGSLDDDLESIFEYLTKDGGDE